MLVPGHLAAAILSAVGSAGSAVRRVSLAGVVLPAALGGLTPDLIDKTRMALGGSVYGRTIGHSLLFFALITALWAATRLRRRAVSGPLGFWVLGVATHLVGDLADDALRGWMAGTMVASSWFAWPWATPYAWTHFAHGTHWEAWPGPFTPLEVVVVAVTVAVLLIRSRRTPPAAA